MGDYCKWKKNEDGQWESECGETFEFSHDGPLENRFKWCPYCGLKLVGGRIRVFRDNATPHLEAFDVDLL